MRLSRAGDVDYGRLRAGMLGPVVPDPRAQERLDRMLPGGGGLLQAMPPWGYAKLSLAERADEILALLESDSPLFNDIVNISTREDHYRVYQGRVFSKRGYEQAQGLSHIRHKRIKARLDAVLEALVRGERYYDEQSGESGGALRVGSYWRAAGEAEGLWIALEGNAVLEDHPVVVGVRRMPAAVIEAGLASGRLKRPLP